MSKKIDKLIGYNNKEIVKMTTKIHIHIYYNLEYKKFISLKNDDYTEEKIIISEVTIVTDELIVRNILTHSKTKTNEYGEFTDYDYNYLEKIVLDDIYKFKEKDTIGCNWNYNVCSFYYIKCEIVKDINNEIDFFLNNF